MDSEPSERLNAIRSANSLRRELHSVISRYGDEHDLTVYEVIGCVEVVKVDLMEELSELPAQ